MCSVFPAAFFWVAGGLVYSSRSLKKTPPLPSLAEAPPMPKHRGGTSGCPISHSAHFPIPQSPRGVLRAVTCHTGACAGGRRVCHQIFTIPPPSGPAALPAAAPVAATVLHTDRLPQRHLRRRVLRGGGIALAFPLFVGPFFPQRVFGLLPTHWGIGLGLW